MFLQIEFYIVRKVHLYGMCNSIGWTVFHRQHRVYSIYNLCRLVLYFSSANNDNNVIGKCNSPMSPYLRMLVGWLIGQVSYTSMLLLGTCSFRISKFLAWKNLSFLLHNLHNSWSLVCLLLNDRPITPLNSHFRHLGGGEGVIRSNY